MLIASNMVRCSALCGASDSPIKIVILRKQEKFCNFMSLLKIRNGGTNGLSQLGELNGRIFRFLMASSCEPYSRPAPWHTRRLVIVGS